MAYDKIQIPSEGEKITLNDNFFLNVPDRPIIPYIEGDGIGVDVSPVMKKVVDAAVEKAYGGQRKIAWMEIYAGEKANKLYGSDVWLPEETVEAAREYVVSTKGPLTTSVGGGIRSLNVALRQQLDLYVCLRPVRYFAGTPSPLKAPENTVRGHPWHRSQVCGPRQGQSRLPDPVRGDDAAAHGLDRGGGPHRPGHGTVDSGQDRHLRLRAPDGRCDSTESFRLR